jgi:hypothetical protein
VRSCTRPNPTVEAANVVILLFTPPPGIARQCRRALRNYTAFDEPARKPEKGLVPRPHSGHIVAP